MIKSDINRRRDPTGEREGNGDNNEDDDFDEFKKWLKTLNISQLQEVYYQQACELNKIRDIILDSVKNSRIKKVLKKIDFLFSKVFKS